MLLRFPLFKAAALLLWVASSMGAFWMWIHFTAFPRGYYLSSASWFYYERLLLPRFPRLPWTKPTPEHYTILGYDCPTGLCLATPESVKTGYKVKEIELYLPKEQVSAILADKVYGGSAISAIILPILYVPFALVAFFSVGVYLDIRRRRQYLYPGKQVSGRKFVPATRFGGRFPSQDDLHIDIENEDPSITV